MSKPETIKMTLDLGFLARIAEDIQNPDLDEQDQQFLGSTLAYCLEEIHRHLLEVRTRSLAGDSLAVHEFFELYSVSDEVYQRPPDELEIAREALKRWGAWCHMPAKLDDRAFEEAVEGTPSWAFPDEA